MVVQRLRSELDGLRRAMRNRAVIEQAKGVLAARLQIGPEDAFDHLLELSQRTNTKLAEVASALIGTTAPDPAAPEVTEIYTDELRRLVRGSRRRTAEKAPAKTAELAGAPRQIRSPQQEALQSQLQLLSGRIAAATSYDEMLAAISDTVTVWPRCATVVLALTELDGALRTVASRGLSAGVRSQWSRIPPQVEVPLAAALRDRSPILLSEPELTELFPIVSTLAPDTRAMACLPLLDGGQALGVLGLSWSEPMRLDEPSKRFLLGLAESCARAIRPASSEARQAELPEGSLLPHPSGPPLTVDHRIEYGLLPIVLDPLYDAAALLAPVTEDDQIVDFEFEYANRAARELSATEQIDLVNSTLLQVFPEVGSRLLLGEYTKVLRTGVPYQLKDLHIAAENEGTRESYTFAANATRIADRVLAVWRVRTDADLLHVQLLQAEGIARAGSFWWNLRSGDLRWSPEMYRLFGRDPQQRAAGLEELQDYIHPDDWLGMQNALNRLLAGRIAELEFRLAGHKAGTRLRIRAEPVVKDSTVYAISGTVRDVSEERAAEARLRRAEEALASQRLRLESERHAAASLRDAVLPVAPELATTPGLAVRGLCRSPERSGHVAGDWFDVIPMPDRRTLLVVGDVAGSGLPATTAATQLRSAVRAYAVLGMSPGELLGALNRMLYDLDPDRLATLGIADFTPRNRRFRWAAAGQATPIRYSGNQDAEELTGSVGVPIGAVQDTTYPDTELTIDPGERLLLYTDGLVVRRNTSTADGLEVLLRAGHEVDLDDIDALVAQVNDKLGSQPYDDLCLVTARAL